MSVLGRVKRWLAAVYVRELPRILREQRWVLLTLFVVHLGGVIVGCNAGLHAGLEERLRLEEQMAAPHWLDKIVPYAARPFYGHSWLWFFSHNLFGALKWSLRGAISLGLLSLVGCSGGAYRVGTILGMTAHVAHEASGVGVVGTAAAMLLPHGLIEVPAFLLSQALSFRIGAAWVWPLRGLRRWASVKRLVRDFGVPLFTIVPLLVIAALLEAHVNPIFVRRYVLGVGTYKEMVNEEIVGRPFAVMVSAWSPDGLRIAAVDWGSRLWVRPIARTGKSVLVAQAADDTSFSTPSWSPDGSQLVVVEWPSNKLLFVDVGSKKTHAAKGGPGERWFGAAWSPEGEVVAVPVLPEARGRPRRTNVWMYNVGTTEWHQITHFAPPIGVAPLCDVSWAPDGRRIAFATNTTRPGSKSHSSETTSAIWVANRDGSAAREIAKIDRCTAVAWSPDSRWIGFIEDTRPRRPESWKDEDFSDMSYLGEVGLVRVDGSERKAKLVRADVYSSLSWSPDSRGLAYQRWGTCILGAPRPLASE